MADRPRRAPVGATRLALPALLALAAWLAIALHRSGHSTGDDFALYLRQARSVFDGDIGGVMADNRFGVVNSGPRFSPTGYPWGWPLVLAPFVRLWGLDYDRLKLLEVALYVAFLASFHGIARRRLGRVAALGLVAVFATAPAYLEYTNNLLSELPHLAALGLFVAWLDRVEAHGGVLRAGVGRLVTLGLAAVAVFEVRREGLVLVGVIAVAQLVALRRDAAPSGGPGSSPRTLAIDRRAELVAPHAAFVVGVVVAQLLLPTALLPDNDNSRSNIPTRLAEYPEILSSQLGLGMRSWIGLVVLALAVAGTVVGARRRPALDLPLAALAVLTALTISTHFRRIDRYWFQVTPWVALLATGALVALAGLVAPLGSTSGARRPGGGGSAGRWRRSAPALGALVVLAPLAVPVVAHATTLRRSIPAAMEFAEQGRVLDGPADPRSAVVYDVIEELTRPDAIVAHHKSRTMTLLTDRRSLQTTDIDRIADRADFYAQRRGRWGTQPDVQASIDAGFVEVWSDDRWILWWIPGSSFPLPGTGGPEG